ncbi:hypothetical protein GCM10023093_27720 [Nemorincola caseinilytica]|uniref:DUF1572 domain-containing protein n=1 Tax=Nemorincola caseinilytica TaxID=2054315 RepID=A0ABP8NMW9_9BACT
MNDTVVAFAAEFGDQCILRMRESTERIERCLGELSETEIWRRPNDQLASVGNLVLHLCGNIGQYILSSLGDRPDSRIRRQEFDAMGGYTRQQLQDMMHTTAEEAIKIIAAATPQEMMRVRMVQGFSMSGIGICVHVTEHYSYHTGQIALHTKLLRNKDLGFYAGQDLDVKNDSGV